MPRSLDGLGHKARDHKKSPAHKPATHSTVVAPSAVVHTPTVNPDLLSTIPRFEHKAAPAKKTNLATPATHPKRRHLPRWATFLIVGFIVLVAIALILFGRTLWAGSAIFSNGSVLQQLRNIFGSDQRTLAQTNGVTNIVLLGEGGPDHDGPNLTDTIMIMRVDQTTKHVELYSVPRDLYIKIPGYYNSRINAVNAIGEDNKPDGKNGAEFLEQVLPDIVGFPIHYYVRVDFTGFKDVIDTIGGVDITVERSFYDYLHDHRFTAGTEHMNGERALAYSRARYVQGPEGGDFARAKRQQQVLKAVKEKMVASKLLIDQNKTRSILQSLGTHMTTSIQLWEALKIYDIVKNIDVATLTPHVLSTDNLLMPATTADGAEVLYPKAGFGKYDAIHTFFTQGFESANVATTSTNTSTNTTTTTVKETGTPKLLVQNGTTTTGFAKRTADTLATKGFTSITTGNASTRTVSKTLLYVNSDKFPTSQTKLETQFGIKSSGKAPFTSDADFVIILGSDQL